jgi:hypothetical protein
MAQKSSWGIQACTIVIPSEFMPGVQSVQAVVARISILCRMPPLISD